MGMLMHLIYRKGGVHLMSIGEESAWYHMGGTMTLLSLHIHKLWNDLALSQVLCSVTMSVCKKRRAMSDRPFTRCQGYFNLFLLHLDASQLARQFIIAWASWTIPVWDCVCNCEFSRCLWGGKQNLLLSSCRRQRSFPTYQITSVLSRPSRKEAALSSQCPVKPTAQCCFHTWRSHILFCALLGTSQVCGGSGDY